MLYLVLFAITLVLANNSFTTVAIFKARLNVFAFAIFSKLFVRHNLAHNLFLKKEGATEVAPGYSLLTAAFTFAAFAFLDKTATLRGSLSCRSRFSALLLCVEAFFKRCAVFNTHNVLLSTSR